MKLVKSKFKRNCGHLGVVWSRSSESIQAIKEHKEYRCGECVLNDTAFIEYLKLATAYRGE